MGALEGGDLLRGGRDTGWEGSHCWGLGGLEEITSPHHLLPYFQVKVGAQ